MRIVPQLTHTPGVHAAIRWSLAATVMLAFLTKPIYAEEQIFPKGIANFVDLTFLANDTIAFTLIGIGGIAAFLFAIGRLRILSITYLVLLCTAVFTFAMGHITKTRHDTNVVPLVLIGYLIAYVQHDFTTRRDPTAFGGRSREDLAFDYGQQMIAAMYVLSGITKLIRCGTDWVKDSVLVVLQMIRTQHCEFYDHLSPPDDLEHWLSIGRSMVEHSNLTRGMFGSALILELFAFAALFGRVWSLLFGLALIAFHTSVFALMNINFYLNMIVLSIFFVNVPYWLSRLRKEPAVATT